MDPTCLNHRGAVGRIGRFVIAAALAVCLAVVPSCSKSAAQQTKGGPARVVPVNIATAVTRAVPIEVATFGTAQAYASVAVRAEITGTVTKVHFKKGQAVRKGDLLFTIDPRPYEAALHQAEAALARDRVQQAAFRKDADRDEALFKKKLTAETDRDKSKAAADSLDATVVADEAALAVAKLQLEHCSISSPIDGRVGNLLLDEGNVVKLTDVVMVQINQVSPIQVFFGVAQDDLPAVRKNAAKGQLTVQAFPPDRPQDAQSGELAFMDNAIDPTTGMIQLAAVLPNKDETLWPGQYVGVRLTISSLKDAVVVPLSAVETGRDGKYVFVVKADDTVEIRPVTPGPIIEQSGVIQKGLKPGDRVVTDGQLRLSPGAKVEARKPAASRANAAPTSGAGPEQATSRRATEAPPSRPAEAGE